MNTDTHCPECGALSRAERDDDGDTVLVCMDDDCPRVIVAVISRTHRAADDDNAGGRNTLTRFADPDFCASEGAKP